MATENPILVLKGTGELPSKIEKADGTDPDRAKLTPETYSSFTKNITNGVINKLVDRYNELYLQLKQQLELVGSLGKGEVAVSSLSGVDAVGAPDTKIYDEIAKAKKLAERLATISCELVTNVVTKSKKVAAGKKLKLPSKAATKFKKLYNKHLALKDRFNEKFDMAVDQFVKGSPQEFEQLGNWRSIFSTAYNRDTSAKNSVIVETPEQVEEEAKKPVVTPVVAEAAVLGSSSMSLTDKLLVDMPEKEKNVELVTAEEDKDVLNRRQFAEMLAISKVGDALSSLRRERDKMQDPEMRDVLNKYIAKCEESLSNILGIDMRKDPAHLADSQKETPIQTFINEMTGVAGHTVLSAEEHERKEQEYQALLGSEEGIARTHQLLEKEQLAFYNSPDVAARIDENSKKADEILQELADEAKRNKPTRVSVIAPYNPSLPEKINEDSRADLSAMQQKFSEEARAAAAEHQRLQEQEALLKERQAAEIQATIDEDNARRDAEIRREYEQREQLLVSQYTEQESIMRQRFEEKEAAWEKERQELMAQLDAARENQGQLVELDRLKKENQEIERQVVELQAQLAQNIDAMTTAEISSPVFEEVDDEDVIVQPFADEESEIVTTVEQPVPEIESNSPVVQSTVAEAPVVDISSQPIEEANTVIPVEVEKTMEPEMEVVREEELMNSTKMLTPEEREQLVQNLINVRNNYEANLAHLLVRRQRATNEDDVNRLEEEIRNLEQSYGLRVKRYQERFEADENLAQQVEVPEIDLSQKIAAKTNLPVVITEAPKNRYADYVASSTPLKVRAPQYTNIALHGQRSIRPSDSQIIDEQVNAVLRK